MFDTNNVDLNDMQISVQVILNDLEDVYDQYNLCIAHLHGLIVQGKDLRYKEKEYWHKTVCNAISKLEQRFNNCLSGLNYLYDLNNELSTNIE